MEDPKMLMCRGCLTVLATVLRHTRWIPAINIICWIAQQNLQKYEDLICAVFSNPLIPLTSIDLFDSKVGHALAPQCNSKWSSATFLGQALRCYITVTCKVLNMSRPLTIIWLGETWSGWFHHGWLACCQLDSQESYLLILEAELWLVVRVRFMLLCLFLRWQWCFSLAKSFHLQSLLGQPSLLAQLHGIQLFIDCPKIEHPSEATTVVIGSSVVSVTWQEVQSEWCNYVSQKIQAI